MVNKAASLGVLNLLAGKALRAPLWLLISALLARVLGPEGLGSWSMILAAGMLMNQLLLHWTQSITQRFGRVEWLDSGSLDSTFSIRLPLLVAGTMLALVALFILPFDWLQRFFGIRSGEVHVLLAMLAFWCMAETQALQQVRERFVHLAWAPISADLVLMGAIAAIALIPMFNEATLAERLQFLLLAMACGWGGWLAWELRGIGFRFPLRSFSWSRLSSQMLFAIPLVPGFLVGYLAEWCDYFLIRHFYGEYEIGLFHPAYQYLLIFIGLPTALVSVLLPRAVQHFEEKGAVAIDLLVKRDAPRFALVWGVLILIPLTVLPGLFLLLVGEAFTSSAALLSIMLAVVPGAIAQHLFGVVYFLQGRLLISTFAFFLVKLLVNAALSAFLLPLIGVTGAAYGVVFSYMILQWLFVIFAVPDHRLLARFAGVLLWCQIIGLLLCLFDGIVPRLLIGCAALALSFCCIRFTPIFDAREIAAVLPQRLKRHEQWLLYWLARPST
ncbi:oligosaccharide flippase family protein [Pseudomonas berkeleyensis]|uniref:Oligosaccharide flippase family protein n=1 Tax=Pseudomonas berkeleyensis TaxID=2726956 RepID=A0A7G5DHZ7_9PSED|nr:oligosaccharide flippase family protein [Pseudomonas berkeleyensis]QMV61372.1 oligosaccharide flippase family protein [Pseudomonas berkeleyensis]WSO36801.1 oligosaccharide flippase family protein [Pseudomonas berkeleyensis]